MGTKSHIRYLIRQKCGVLYKRPIKMFPARPSSAFHCRFKFAPMGSQNYARINQEVRTVVGF